MPTRTINLKMVLGKRNETAELRRALWTTHHEINQAVAQIERLLLFCRGREYRTVNENNEEIVVPESEVTAQALRLARDAQERNSKGSMGADEEVLSALRALYTRIVPSCELDEKGKPAEGNAQASNAWVSPLMDSESQGGLGVYEKLIEPPEWMEMMRSEHVGWQKNSENWLKTEEAKRLQFMPGSPPAWVRRLRKGDPWQEAFVKDQEKKEKEVREGNAPIIKQLKELGLLPLMPPTIINKIDPIKTGVSVWDRLAMRLAVAHLLSWESWNHETLDAHNSAKARLTDLRQQYSELKNEFAELREYEKQRHLELKRVAFADDNRPFKIGPRMIRAWERVRQTWLKARDAAEQRKDTVKKLQTKMRGRFGDPDLLIWMAEDGRERLWRNVDVLTPLARLNVAERLLEKRKAYALMTFADARMHPRWACYEAPSGTNLRNYTLTSENGELYVAVPLLVERTGGLLENLFHIRLAPNAQFADVFIARLANKNLQFSFRSSHESFEGAPGGAELLFDRAYLEHPERTPEKFAVGAIGPVWFKLTMDIKSKAPKEWLDGRGRVATPPEVWHFLTALSNKSKHVDRLAPGLRVLSVDLGLRTFASCSVFELVREKPSNGLYFPVADEHAETDPKKLWAKHERSFKLSLPGEVVSRKGEQERKAAMDEIHALKRDIQRLKDLLSMSVIGENDRRDDRLALLEASIDTEKMASSFRADLLTSLKDPTYRSTPGLWETKCREIYDQAEALVSQRFSEWRRRTRPRSTSWRDWDERRGYCAGKSIWAIDYLTGVRKLILSWNLRARTYGAVNRQNKEEFGTIAAKLLRHINSLKEDRLKTGANLLVQAARGYKPSSDGLGWKKTGQEACRVILFEDLARYRFRVDRPRRENSQLMKWGHRGIVSEATMQGELFGIVAETTAAGFSSRYLAASGAPGTRCRVLREDDFVSGIPKPHVVFELDWMLGNRKSDTFEEKQIALAKKLTAGMLVPWSGGEIFASKNADGSLHIIHADINAAQNLQRRFWGRCGEAFRITCEKVTGDDEDRYQLDKLPGARLLGALQQLEGGAHAFHLAKDQNHDERFVMAPTGEKNTKIRAGEDDEIGDEFAETMGDLDRAPAEDRVTFFRDPSGVLFNSRYWVPTAQYWGIVKQIVWAELKKSNIPVISDDIISV